MKGKKVTEIEKLNQETQGWTIERIDQGQLAEHLFTLILSNGHARKRVQVYGTDLGWWVGRIEKAKAIKR